MEQIHLTSVACFQEILATFKGLLEIPGTTILIKFISPWHSAISLLSSPRYIMLIFQLDYDSLKGLENRKARVDNKFKKKVYIKKLSGKTVRYR